MNESEGFGRGRSAALSMDLAMPKRAIAFVAITAACGCAVVGESLWHWQSEDLLKFACYLVIAMLASTMKVRLPGIESTMSVHFLFVLLGVLELSLAETLVIGCAAALLQSLWKAKHRPETIKVIFNVLSMTANAIWLTYVAYHSAARVLKNSEPLLLLIVACSYFIMNTVPLSVVIALSQRSSLRRIWSETYFWSFPYYLVGAAMVGLVSFCNRYVGWQNALLIVPVMFWIYRSYHLYLGRLEDAKKRAEMEAAHVEAEKRHVEEVCALHLRTIEGLALAIDAKDHTTHSHLHRVRTYAVEIAKDMELSPQDLDALRAAALLHDIGKLAVPDHIINKPGRLTPEEFEKMKIHPIVGAEILEKVAFPYPVAPIVRSHHERWNGEGYPDGLKGEEIPIGARILAAVDCLDALASDRQYRKALPLDEAMAQIARESGAAFDPRVVEILQAAIPRPGTDGHRKPGRSTQGRAGGSSGRGAGPRSGRRLRNRVHDPRQSQRLSVLDCFGALRSPYAVRAEPGPGQLPEPRRDALPGSHAAAQAGAVRLHRGLRAQGQHAAAGIRQRRQLPAILLAADPGGDGLCGWVAQNVRPILNGNPAVETGFTQAGNGSEPRSALVVPLEGLTGLVGVLALYQAAPEAFTSDHLRVLQVITSRVALFIENALKYREAESSATIDFLTGMANARALSMHLEQELARCKREGSTHGGHRLRPGRIQADQRLPRPSGRRQGIEGVC